MSHTFASTPAAPRPAARAPAGRMLYLGDTLFRLLCQVCASLILAIIALLVVVLLVRAWLAISTLGFGFLLEKRWDPVDAPGHRVFGSLAFLYGTVVTSAIAMLIAAPLGVGTAAYLSEIASARLKRVASFFIEMLAAIPSVVYGFWGMYVLAPQLQRVYTWLGAPNTGGMGILTAGIVLSIMIVPYIAAITYDVCQAVPRSQREGALALGATRWQTIWRVVLPYARPGILGGAFLALGRALGETMAVTMLIGNNQGKIPLSLFSPGDSIASVIANQYVEASYDLYKSVLVELGLLLFVVTIAINSLARLLIWRVTRPRSGGPGLWARFRGWFSGALPGRRLTAEPPAAPAPTTDAAPDAPPRRVSRLPAGSEWAQGVNRVMTGVLGSCVAFTMGVLVLILGYLTYRGVGSLNWTFFTELPVKPTETGGGMANAIYGSFLVVGLATLFAVPVGLLAAIYLAEYRANALSRSVRFLAEALGGVPSIVIGIFAAALFGIVADTLRRTLGWRVRLYGWAGVFALAVMMLPIVIRAAEEALKLVPSALRNAAYALGASQAQTVVRVTVPAALPAIVTAIFLSIARIAGETAPLLLTVGFNSDWPESMGDFLPTLPVYIFKYATSAFENQQKQAWAGAFVLMAVVLLLNFGIRYVAGKRVVQASRAD